jgi:hypothetical protein
MRGQLARARGTFGGREMELTRFIFRTEEGNRIQSRTHHGFAYRIDFAQSREQALAGVP